MKESTRKAVLSDVLEMCPISSGGRVEIRYDHLRGLRGGNLPSENPRKELCEKHATSTGFDSRLLCTVFAMTQKKFATTFVFVRVQIFAGEVSDLESLRYRYLLRVFLSVAGRILLILLLIFSI